MKPAGEDCAIGTYGNQSGLMAQADCTPCDAGYHCPMPGLTTPYQECQAGHYCQLGAEFSNPYNETWGYLCTEGHYCPQGTPTLVDCPTGTYQPLEGLTFKYV